jgi:L-glyceraldehyde 3-phosphate reductase
MFGRIHKEDLKPYRDELIISTKAGWPMWPGPYGDLGSKKYLIASLDQSLKRLGLDYVDIFYHHRPDPDTPLEETASALDLMVRQGKALYIGVSSYSPLETQKMYDVLKSMGTPLIIHQPKYSLLERTIEKGLLPVLAQNSIGCITFSSLAQGLLTDKYLDGIPQDSRAASERGNGALDASGINEDILEKVRALNELAKYREQSLAQMSLAWVLKDPRITSVIIGASKAEQVIDSVRCLRNITFNDQELKTIEDILLEGQQ